MQIPKTYFSVINDSSIQKQYIMFDRRWTNVHEEICSGAQKVVIQNIVRLSFQISNIKQN